jgi:WD40-like Beta Propeller Repeat
MGMCCAAMLLAACQQEIKYPMPRTKSLAPATIQAGQPAFTLTVNGSNFTPASSVLFNGSARITLFQSVNVLTAQIQATDIQNAGQADVAVSTPTPGGGISNPPLTFTITPAPSLAPQITGLSPSGVTTGSPAFNITITGKNFFTQSTITVNGITRPALFINSTTLETGIAAQDVANSGTVEIAVTNPPPNGGTSAPFGLTVSNPVPGISTIGPSSVQAGSTPGQLSVTGTGFVPNSVVNLNGSPHTTVFGSGTSLAINLSAADLAAGSIDQVTVFNPGPGGGTSNIEPFPITPTDTAGLPVLVDVAPNGAQANNGVCGTCISSTPAPNLAGPSASSTGEFVAFASNSTNLISVTTPTNGLSDIFLRDTCLGTTCAPTTILASTSYSNGATDGPSFEPSLANGGSIVAFTSTASNIVNYVSVAGGARQVYWSVPCATSSTAACTTNSTGPSVLVSIAADGLTAGNGESYNPSISPDGQYVAFVSLATNLVTGVTTADGITPQVYVRSVCNGVTPITVTPTCTPTTYLVSSADGVTPGNGASSHPVVGTAGSFVAFVSIARNLGATAPNPSGAQEIFEQQECLGSAGCTLATSLISTPDGVTPASGTSSEPTMSPDGRFVAFASTAANLGITTGGVQQIFLRDTCSNVTTIPTTCTAFTYLVSSPDTSTQPATPANGLSENPSIAACSAVAATTCTTGELVAFASNATNLGSNVQNGIENIFVRDTCLALASTTTGCTARVGLASQPAGTLPAPANGSSNYPSISADGHTVAFFSAASNLVSGDNNGLADIFLGASSF